MYVVNFSKSQTFSLQCLSIFSSNLVWTIANLGRNWLFFFLFFLFLFFVSVFVLMLKWFPNFVFASPLFVFCHLFSSTFLFVQIWQIYSSLVFSLKVCSCLDYKLSDFFDHKSSFHWKLKIWKQSSFQQ